jgi:predicted nucleotidyltransferase
MFENMNITKTDLEILTFMCQRSEGEWHVRHLAKDAGVSAGATSEGLRRLEALGLVEKKKKGKMVFYRLFDEKPAVQTYKKTLTLFSLEPIILKIRDISERIILFGSAAEGTETSESDIDLLVITTQKKKVRALLRAFRTVNGHEFNPIILTPSELIALSNNDKAFYTQTTRGIVLWRS